MIDRELLQTTLAEWQLTLTTSQIDRLEHYVALLTQWSERMNLVAPSTLPEATRRHLLDSFSLATTCEQAPASLADIGSGAGLPGIPLAILWPETEVLLIESIGKKAEFLRHVAQELQLERVLVEVERAEVVGRERRWREHFALVTARAVANLATLAEYCLPLCQVGGMWLAPKGFEIEPEVQDAEQAITILGGQLRAVYNVTIPDEPVRSLVVVDKVASTPLTYPRTVGTPSKKPL